MDVPPKLTPAKSLRLAMALNFALPGAGQWYLGQRWLGGLLAVIFAVCLVLGMKFLLGGMSLYFRVASDGRILEPGVLEQLATAFHLPGLITATVASVILQIVSIAQLWFGRKRISESP